MPDQNVQAVDKTWQSDLVHRIGRLEDGHNEIIRRHFEFDKELSGFQIDLKYIREGLDQTKGGINKLLWGIGAVFITYVVGFIVSGGLTALK